ncbi:unnamed protein product [Amoebophrya sp. A25]|nr:unnamed protein product [Amoebophrya sp. A25]|eukprot:GSA25T00016981001.1
MGLCLFRDSESDARVEKINSYRRKFARVLSSDDRLNQECSVFWIQMRAPQRGNVIHKGDVMACTQKFLDQIDAGDEQTLSGIDWLLNQLERVGVDNVGGGDPLSSASEVLSSAGGSASGDQIEFETFQAYTREMMMLLDAEMVRKLESALAAGDNLCVPMSEDTEMPKRRHYCYHARDPKREGFSRTKEIEDLPLDSARFVREAREKYLNPRPESRVNAAVNSAGGGGSGILGALAPGFTAPSGPTSSPFKVPAGGATNFNTDQSLLSAIDQMRPVASCGRDHGGDSMTSTPRLLIADELYTPRRQHAYAHEMFGGNPTPPSAAKTQYGEETGGGAQRGGGFSFPAFPDMLAEAGVEGVQLSPAQMQKKSRTRSFGTEDYNEQLVQHQHLQGRSPSVLVDAANTSRQQMLSRQALINQQGPALKRTRGTNSVKNQQSAPGAGTIGAADLFPRGRAPQEAPLFYPREEAEDRLGQQVEEVLRQHQSSFPFDKAEMMKMTKQQFYRDVDEQGVVHSRTATSSGAGASSSSSSRTHEDSSTSTSRKELNPYFPKPTGASGSSRFRKRVTQNNGESNSYKEESVSVEQTSVSFAEGGGIDSKVASSPYLHDGEQRGQRSVPSSASSSTSICEAKERAPPPVPVPVQQEVEEKPMMVSEKEQEKRAMNEIHALVGQILLAEETTASSGGVASTSSGEVVLDCFRRIGQIQPITVNVLRETKIGVFTQKYKNHSSTEVQKFVRSLRQQWTDVVRRDSSSATSTTSTSTTPAKSTAPPAASKGSLLQSNTVEIMRQKLLSEEGMRLEVFNADGGVEWTSVRLIADDKGQLPSSIELRGDDPDSSMDFQLSELENVSRGAARGLLPSPEQRKSSERLLAFEFGDEGSLVLRLNDSESAETCCKALKTFGLKVHGGGS